jgi:hypothetical protein
MKLYDIVAENPESTVVAEYPDFDTFSIVFS